MICEIIVCSQVTLNTPRTEKDIRFAPLYKVVLVGVAVLYESNSAREAIQWALDLL